MFTTEQIVLSVLINGAVLIAVFFLKSAPPRMVLYVCLAGMLAIVVPWTYIGTEVESYVPSNMIASGDIPSVAAVSLKAADSSTGLSIVTIWLGVGVIWLLISIMKSIYTKRVWRSSAMPGNTLIKYANPAFNKILHRTRVYRIPGSSLVFATGLWRPEIWIGDEICSGTQIEAALNHELAHIESNDQLTLFLIVALERLLWWNPLIWLLGSQARHQMEYACDSRCQLLIGTTSYRNSLAELFLVQQARLFSLELTLGNESPLITRMDKIGMTHSIRPNHIVTLVLAGSAIAIACVSMAETGTAPRAAMKTISSLQEAQNVSSEAIIDRFDLTEIKRLENAGQYQQALQKHLWFHEKSKSSASMAGVRLSYALDSWLELGRKYPPALDALIAVKNKNKELLLSGEGGFGNFHDLFAINRVLGMNDATLELFLVLEAKYPRADVKSFYIVAEGLLIKAKQYELISKYIRDPIIKYEDLRYMRELNLSQAKNMSGLERPSFLNSVNEEFVAGVMNLIGVSQAINKDDAAIEIQKRALAYFDNDKIEKAIP